MKDLVRRPLQLAALVSIDQADNRMKAIRYKTRQAIDPLTKNGLTNFSPVINGCNLAC